LILLHGPSFRNPWMYMKFIIRVPVHESLPSDG
jgi:hypothetical protein